MFYRTSKRYLALFVACLLLLLCACSGGVSVGTDTTHTPDETTAPTDTAPVSQEPDETTYPAPVISEDLSGKTIRILATEAREPDFPYSEINYDEVSGDIINDAVFRRNALISEKHGLTIEGYDAEFSINGLNGFLKSINAGNNDYHFASLRISDMLTAAQQGVLADVSELPYLDLDAPWYYQTVRKQLSVGGVERMIMGYFNMHSFDSMTYIAYNKNVADRYEIGIDELNRLALDGKWTLDKLHEYASMVGIDINHDGKIDAANDEIGMLSHSGYITTFFIGMGGNFIEKNSEDIPVFVGLTEQNEKLLSRIVEVLYDSPASLHGLHDAVYLEPNPLQTDRALFETNLIYSMRDLTEKGVNYGVLPFPKADEAQEQYYSHAHFAFGSAIAIPHNNPEMDFTAAVLAELMYYSQEIIYPAHIQRAMELRFSPDEYSTEMLKLLFDSICVEMTTALKLSCDTQLRTMGGLHMTNFTSVFKSIHKSNAQLVENYVNAVQ